MPVYKIGNEEVNPDQPDYQDILSAAYREKVRPLCLCKEPPAEMYIACLGEKFFVKRMPYSGVSHAANCESYEVPPELSGRGNLDGSAIRRDEDGMTTLKFEFSLSRHATKGERSEGAEKTSIKSPGSRMSLRAMLHFLWDEAGFTRWSPGMTGKRNWKTLRYYLLKEAAEGKETRRTPLTELLYIPEHDNEEKRDEINARRTLFFAPMAQSRGKKLMLVLGEYLRDDPGRFGHNLFLKHLPDYPFRLSDEAHKLFQKHFKRFKGLAGHLDEDARKENKKGKLTKEPDPQQDGKVVEGSHLMVLATFGLDEAFVPEISEITVMLTTKNWIPVENDKESELLDRLTAEDRRFVKVLRYDLRSTEPIATAILTDTAPDPYAMYVVTDIYDSNTPSRNSVDAMIASSKLPSWVWDIGKDYGAFPPLPEKAPWPPKAQSRFEKTHNHVNQEKIKAS